MFIPRMLQENPFTAGPFSTEFSTRFMQQAPSPSSKSASCPKLPRPIRSHIVTVFPRAISSADGRIHQTIIRSGPELVFHLVQHLRERYGDAEVKTWLWEVWNEPDIPYWKGTPEEYFKLYDYSVDAVLRALPDARVGGPDSTGPGSPKAAEFLRNFLDHCAHQRNQVTGKTGSQLDFIAFHPKGSPAWQGDHVVMGMARQLASIEQGFKIVKSFPEWHDTPIILGESDPEGCAACSARTNPQNGYRNGALYAAYTAEAIKASYALAAREQVRLAGSVTWSFEFEAQPYFEGFRELASNGLDKPVLNTFRMFGLLGSERVKVSSTGALPT